jgi:lipopolysaccharide export LptBFGC system permease protein LptF
MILLLLLLLIVMLIAVIIVIFYSIKQMKVTCHKSKQSAYKYTVSFAEKKTVPPTSALQESTATHDDDEGADMVVNRRSSADSDKPKPVTMTGFGTILSDDNGLAETEEENREMPSTTRKKQNSLKTQKKKNKFRKSKYKPGEVPTTEKGNEEIVLAKSKTTSDFPNKRGTQSIGVGSGFESGASIPYQEGDSQEPLMPYDSSEVPRYT